MDRARRYVAWLDRHFRVIVVGHVLAFGLALWLIATRLPLHAELTDLLPQQARSVVAMHALEKRVAAADTVLAVIDAPVPALRIAAEAELAAELAALPPTLVTRVVGDRADARAFLWNHRFQLAPLAEVRRVRDALRRHIDDAKLHANPIYVDLDDEKRPPDRELDELRAKSRDAERDLHRPSNVSADGRRAVIEIRTATSATDVEGGKRAFAALGEIRDRVRAHHPLVLIGYAGDVVTAIAEHDAILDGIVISALVTTALVLLVLVGYVRSVRLIAMLSVTLVIATTVAFGVAAVTVGHLNAATAFLGSIIAGNGINYGILLVARFVAERRRPDTSLEEALASAIAGTLRPTIVASLGAAIAYGALGAASFQGFSEFAVIGSIGMLLCWIASFVLLPALVLRFAPVRPPPTHDHWLDVALVRVFGVRHRRVVLSCVAAATLACTAIAIRFVATDPFEYDMRELGSVSAASETERHWMAVSASVEKGIAGRTVIAAARPDQVPLIVEALAAPERRAAIGSVASILNVVPEHQDEELALLAEIRAMIDDAGDDAELDANDRARFRPPDDLVPITERELPASLRELVTETSGRVGLLVSLRPATGLDELDGHDMIRFARAAGVLRLANGEIVETSGPSIVFAEILETIERDGPRVVVVVVIALGIMLVFGVKPRRSALAVLAATVVGAVAMVAACAVLGIRVTFLDLVALPVTLGLGIDYAINVANGPHDDPIAMLHKTGAAVFVCSLTTMIGYASLLVSDNLAIRGFGRASLVGEITTVTSALVVVPALLASSRGSSPARAS